MITKALIIFYLVTAIACVYALRGNAQDICERAHSHDVCFQELNR